MQFLKGLYRFFSSFALASVVLIFLTIITLVGTLDQVDLGLFAAKKRYFHSFFTYYEIPVPFDTGRFRGIPIPLPGGVLLMMILFINMTMGALVHVRKRLKGVPMLIAHSGILFLLVSSFVTWTQKRDGYVALYPGTSTNRAQSYREWQIEVVKLDEADQPKEAVIIPWENLKPIGEEGKQTFTSPAFPFSVNVDGFYRNARPIPVSAPISSEAKGAEIDGFKLLKRNKDVREEANFPGCYVKIVGPGSNAPIDEFILSGISDKISPDDKTFLAGFEYEDQKWGIQLVKKSWDIAFSLELEKFIFEKHPGTTRPKNFESRVSWWQEDDQDRKKVAIRMNEPMRQSGFVVFQESYGPPDPGPNEVMYSQFAVSDDPADAWPGWALIVILTGLALHFIMMLALYIGRSGNRKKTSAQTAAELA